MTTSESTAAWFEWDGQPLPTIGELLSAADAAERAGRAQEFLTAYRAHTPHADGNLGYIIGYMGDEDRARMYAAYALVHPIFGGTS